MVSRKAKSGFTLIELLVVITIIGILATGAVTVYTTQIQKARDTTRIRDVDALKGAAEQVYQDDAEYPSSTTFYEQMNTYIKRLPGDSKHGQTCNSGAGGTTTVCGYAYVVGDDSNSIGFGAYEFSTAFENEANRETKGERDGGNDPLRLEQGLDIDAAAITTNSSVASANVGICQDDGNAAATATTKIIINGNPTNTNPTTPAEQCN